MIKILLLTTLINIAEEFVMPSKPTEIEARKRGKKSKGRRRGGRGLR
tara:strand:+ start:2543 stop:2683 length:141 start_codon:yes stop_codon:yes gene_type:complete